MSLKVDDATREKLKKMTPKERAKFQEESLTDIIALLTKAKEEAAEKAKS